MSIRAPQFPATDMNWPRILSLMQYAVEALKVGNIIVRGQYGCGGVQGAIATSGLGLIDNWLRRARRDAETYIRTLWNYRGVAEGASVCEVNVIEQVVNVCHMTGVREAWRRGEESRVDGLTYGLEDGLLPVLGICVTVRSR